MAAVESEADDKFANVDVDSILSRVGRRPLTFNKTRFLYKIPEFVKRLTGEETVNEGTTVQLETKVTGIPRPTLRWFKDEEEIVDHPRIHVESSEDGVYVFTVENVNKGDEAAYRCRAENEEGSASSMFYLHVKVKPKSPKRSSKHLTKRTVSYPPMFPTIVEKVEEEEKEAKETARSPPSPLTQLYDGLTLQTRHTWPKFLGDWAYVENAHRNGGSIGSETDSETCDGHSLESIEHDEVFTEESCEKSTEGEHASFYVSSDDVTPETPDSVSGDMKEGEEEANSNSQDTCQITNVRTHSDGVNKSADFLNGNSNNVSIDSVKHEDIVAKPEPNNNETKTPRGKRDMHLPLSHRPADRDKAKDKAGDSVVADKTAKKKKEKDPSVKKVEEKKNGEKVKVTKKTEDKEKSDKLVKKTDKEKDKVTKKSDSKEKVVKNENTTVKKSDSKDDTKSKPKSKDGQKSPPEKKSVKKTDLKEKKTDSLKRKSESKEKKSKCDYISNPDPPILGSARPLVFTNLASKLASYTCTDSEQDNNPHGTPDVYLKTSEQYDVKKQYKDVNGDVMRSHENKDLAIVPPPLGDMPFGRYFEEFIFVVCLFTFLALCIGIPSETFVLVVLGMHFVYSMVTVMELC